MKTDFLVDLKQKYWRPQEASAELKKFWPPRAGVEEVKRRLKPQAVLAITVESRRLVAELVRRQDAPPGKGWGITLPLGAEQVLADPEAAGKALAAEFAAGGIRERKCALCLPPSWALAVSMDIPEMTEEDLRGFLELRAEREFPIPPTELRLAHCTFHPPDGSPRATLAAIPNKRMRAVERMLEVAGGQAVSISLGLNRCLGETKLAAVHLLANCDRVDVVVTAGGGIAALRSIAGPAATEETFNADAFCREVRITLGRLPEGLRKQVREAHFGGSRATAETLCRKTREQFHRMGVEPTAIDREEEHAAFEAGQHFLAEEPMPFEFVEPVENKWDKFAARFEKPQHRQMLAVGAGLIVLLFFTFWIRAHILSSLEAEWKGMAREVTDLEDVQKNIRKYRAWFNPTPETLPVLETLVSAFPENGDAWAKTIQVTEVGSKCVCTGFARNQAAFLAIMDRLRTHPGVVEATIQQVRGQNPVEFSLTFKTEPKP